MRTKKRGQGVLALVAGMSATGALGVAFSLGVFSTHVADHARRAADGRRALLAAECALESAWLSVARRIAEPDDPLAAAVRRPAADGASVELRVDALPAFATWGAGARAAGLEFVSDSVRLEVDRGRALPSPRTPDQKWSRVRLSARVRTRDRSVARTLTQERALWVAQAGLPAAYRERSVWVNDASGIVEPSADMVRMNQVPRTRRQVQLELTRLGNWLRSAAGRIRSVDPSLLEAVGIPGESMAGQAEQGATVFARKAAELAAEPTPDVEAYRNAVALGTIPGAAIEPPLVYSTEESVDLTQLNLQVELARLDDSARAKWTEFGQLWRNGMEPPGGLNGLANGGWEPYVRSLTERFHRSLILLDALDNEARLQASKYADFAAAFTVRTGVLAEAVRSEYADKLQRGYWEGLATYRTADVAALVRRLAAGEHGLGGVTLLTAPSTALSDVSFFREFRGDAVLVAAGTLALESVRLAPGAHHLSVIGLGPVRWDGAVQANLLATGGLTVSPSSRLEGSLVASRMQLPVPDGVRVERRGTPRAIGHTALLLPVEEVQHVSRD